MNSMTDIEIIQPNSAERGFAGEYVLLLDYFSRVADAVNRGSGDWRYVRERLQDVGRMANVLVDRMSEDREDPEDGHQYRGVAQEFTPPPPPRSRDPFDFGPPLAPGQTRPVPAGYVDAGKVRAAIAALGWTYTAGRALHPVAEIEDRFSDLRDQAVHDQQENDQVEADFEAMQAPLIAAKVAEAERRNAAQRRREASEGENR